MHRSLESNSIWHQVHKQHKRQLLSISEWSQRLFYVQTRVLKNNPWTCTWFADLQQVLPAKGICGLLPVLLRRPGDGGDWDEARSPKSLLLGQGGPDFKQGAILLWHPQDFQIFWPPPTRVCISSNLPYLSCFSCTPLPSSADVINGCPPEDHSSVMLRFPSNANLGYFQMTLLWIATSTAPRMSWILLTTGSKPVTVLWHAVRWISPQQWASPLGHQTSIGWGVCILQT